MSKKKRHKFPLSQQLPQQPPLLTHQEVRSMFRQEFSGPLPPPDALEKYKDIIPNGAERIMVMAEEQSKHRRALETKALNTDSRNSLLGVIFAFILGLAALITGGVIVYIGKSISGTIFGSTGLVALVSAFIYGTSERRKERENKAKAS